MISDNSALFCCSLLSRLAMVPVFSVAGEQLLTIELSEFDAADGLCLEAELG